MTFLALASVTYSRLSIKLGGARIEKTIFRRIYLRKTYFSRLFRGLRDRLFPFRLCPNLFTSSSQIQAIQNISSPRAFPPSLNIETRLTASDITCYSCVFVFFSLVDQLLFETTEINF